MIPNFAVISGTQVHEALSGREAQIIRIVESAYRLHGEGATVNPDSYFLRFPDRPSARIGALPASVRGDLNIHGIKWIASFPENVHFGLPRASAVLILNDPDTGYPFACMESSIISAARTAASAALAVAILSERRDRPVRRIGFFGAGLIARYIQAFLKGSGVISDTVGVYDTIVEHSVDFRRYLTRTGTDEVVVHESTEGLIRSSDLIVFATVASEPHITDPAWFGHAPLVLHISLRDLSPEIILSVYNIVDDVEHCLKADTSLHLTERQVGHHEFVAGTLYDVLTGSARPPSNQTIVFSPFGLGVLDLAVAHHVYQYVSIAGALQTIPGFFYDLKRYG